VLLRVKDSLLASAIAAFLILSQRRQFGVKFTASSVRDE